MSKPPGRFAAECDRLFLAVRRAPFEERVRAFEDLKRRYLKQTKSEATKLELRRRIAEWLISLAHDRPWPTLLVYLRRLGRLGFSAAHIAAWWSALASRAAPRDRESREVVLRMIERAENVLGSSGAHAAYIDEQLALLRRARQRVGA